MTVRLPPDVLKGSLTISHCPFYKTELNPSTGPLLPQRFRGLEGMWHDKPSHSSRPRNTPEQIRLLHDNNTTTQNTFPQSGNTGTFPHLMCGSSKGPTAKLTLNGRWLVTSPRPGARPGCHHCSRLQGGPSQSRGAEAEAEAEAPGEKGGGASPLPQYGRVFRKPQQVHGNLSEPINEVRQISWCEINTQASVLCLDPSKEQRKKKIKNMIPITTASKNEMKYQSINLPKEGKDWYPGNCIAFEDA